MRQVTAPRFNDAGGTSDDLLRRRISLVLWIVVVGNLFFAATDPWLNPGLLRELTLVKVCLIAVQLVGLVLLRRDLGRRAAVAVALTCGAAATAGGTVAGVIVHDPFTTPLLCASAALLTAAVIPWGSRVQLAVAVINVVGGSLVVWLVSDLPTVRYVIVVLVVVAGLSVYIAHVLGEQRAAEARATLALQQHQAELAHVLRVSAMGEMAAQLAHELTQPLGAIANYAAGCRRRMEAAPAQPRELIDAVDRISHEALRAGEIIRRLREFVQKAEPRRAPVDVNRLVREVAELVDGEAQTSGVALRLALEPALPEVDADRIQIEQVVVNLVRNALEALRDSPGDAPSLDIETRVADAHHIEVTVCDSGPGLANGEGAKIFEPFHTTKRAGLGMGLAISRSIVEAHGGRLWVAPNPTRGVTFHFTLPATAPAGTNPARAREHREREAG